MHKKNMVPESKYIYILKIYPYDVLAVAVEDLKVVNSHNPGLL
jgi:hypothetical protein